MSLTTGSEKIFDASALWSHLRSMDWSRTIRLASGFILLAFVAGHLINHALGLIGIEVMDIMQEWRWWVWKSAPGSLLLYGAFAAHIALTLGRIVRRGTLRMPLKEALQLVLGLSIPFLLVGHVVSTRLAGDVYGVDESYGPVLQRLWPAHAVWQSVLVVVVWCHGMIGLHYVIAARRKAAGLFDEVFITIGVLVPVLALAGFMVAAREVRGQPAAAIEPPALIFIDRVQTYGRFGALALVGGVAGTLALREIVRRRRRNITVSYVGHGEVTVKPGLSLLEISRDRRIPHPSLCGGRGRCATCRVLVTKGAQDLPSAAAGERAVLDQITAPPGVRLACQVHPTHDLSVQILLPSIGERSQVTQSEHAGWGLAESASVLVVDLRAFTNLANRQVPYELVVLLSRFQEEMSQAVHAHGGSIDLVVVDGLTAVFRPGGQKDQGSRSALKAARDMFRAIEALNAQFKGALPMPLRIGIGIHTGQILTARVAVSESAVAMLALGETVAVASRLELASKDMLHDLVISRETAEAAGLQIMQSQLREIYVSGRQEPVAAYPVGELGDLERFV